MRLFGNAQKQRYHLADYYEVTISCTKGHSWKESRSDGGNGPFFIERETLASFILDAPQRLRGTWSPETGWPPAVPNRCPLCLDGAIVAWMDAHGIGELSESRR